MTKPKILLQFDPDPYASVFDAVVAIDAGINHLLQYRDVQPDSVRDLVHGSMFTRGPQDLQNTAIFIGGTSVAAGEALLTAVVKCFFGPMRVSVLLDSNGANTTAAAAVLAATRHVALQGAEALVLGGTGPVGQRAARLLARQGARVRLASRSLDRASEACAAIAGAFSAAVLRPTAVGSASDAARALDGVSVVIAAGAAGVELIPNEVRRAARDLKVVIDLNAVPPLGIGGIEAMDKARERDGQSCYGALGVGGTKMKIHRAAVQKLFTANDFVLDAEEVFAIGQGLAN
jgi:methylenetetrahydrofolate/methylenetetrahydromethanopterin dehydrogenase (NADP+)